jgi:Uma2 family endonuclease
MADPAIKDDHHYTYAEYASWPDEERWELIGGVAWNMSPAPERRHQALVWELAGQIRARLGETGCSGFTAPFDVFPYAGPGDDLASADTVVQPDIAVVCDSEKLAERGCVGPPDLVIEVLSPTTMSKDLGEKRALYDNSGVAEYWVVSPVDETVLVFDRQGHSGFNPAPRIVATPERLRSSALPALCIDLRALFAALR